MNNYISPYGPFFKNFILKVSINDEYKYRISHLGKVEFLNPLSDNWNESLTHKKENDLIKAGAVEVK